MCRCGSLLAPESPTSAILAPVAPADPDRALSEMCENDLKVAAAQDDMVAREMVGVDIRDRHVRQAFDGDDHRSRAWRENRRAEDAVAGRVARHDALGAQSPAVDGDDVDAPGGSKPRLARSPRTGRARPHGR